MVLDIIGITGDQWMNPNIFQIMEEIYKHVPFSINILKEAVNEFV